MVSVSFRSFIIGKVRAIFSWTGIWRFATCMSRTETRQQKFSFQRKLSSIGWNFHVWWYNQVINGTKSRLSYTTVVSESKTYVCWYSSLGHDCKVLFEVSFILAKNSWKQTWNAYLIWGEAKSMLFSSSVFLSCSQTRGKSFPRSSTTSSSSLNYCFSA